LLSANGSEIKIVYQAEVEIYLKGLKIYQTVGIAKELNPHFLLGVDFLSANKATICYKTGTLSLLENLVQIPMHSMCDETNCVETTPLVNVPKHFNNKSIVLEESQHAKCYPIAVQTHWLLSKTIKQSAEF